MIRKYRFGNPLNTEAVVKEYPIDKGEIPCIEVKEGEKISFIMTKGAPVYGLGEQVRGINKRGWIYTSNCTDDPNHREDTHSLYAAHNFLVFAETEPFGLFLDNPGKVTFDIGYTQQDTVVITMDSWDMDLYYIDGKDLKDIVKQFRYMVGRSYIPPKWAFGFGQSRWGYQSEEDIREVEQRYRELDIPLDSIYLDIDYMERFKDFTLNSVLYDIDVPGYESGCNRLHLFDVDTIDESLVPEDSIDFDKKKIQKNLTLFLYPDDSDDDGRKLRIYQQYFMVSCGAQLILKECEDKGYDLHKLNEHVVIQINDTHPSMVIPELIRLLAAKGFTMDEAVEIVSKTCAYTNHTILAEALEKWPMDYLEEVVPHLLPIIKELDERVREKYTDESVYIIDEDERVHMAHMDIHYGFSVNGVAALHTEILKNTELNNFYKIYPEKFNNKTNGITFRRWLLHCNRELAAYIESLIGSGFKKDADQLEKLLAYKDDEKVLEKLAQIKVEKKLEFKKFMKETQDMDLDENSIFDVQVKRLHEYKRQQMNALYAIYKYLDIKAGNKPKTPITMIFGAKAAPAYVIAKDIIHLILCLHDLIENDPEVKPYFRVLMIENYNVSKAAKVIPAADISEQISLASKEASGTGNMKFMLNGALTLGTEDGANVEIRDLVGDENIYIFGKRPQEVIDLYAEEAYCAEDIYEKDKLIHKLVDFIIGDELLAIGDKESLTRKNW